MKLALFLLSLTASAQTLTFSPQPSKVSGATVWAVSACAAPGTVVPIGRVYQSMVIRGITPLFNSAAIAALQAKQTGSLQSKLYRWSGYAVGGLAVLMTTKVITSNVQYQQAAQLGMTFFNILIPIVQKDIPASSQWQAQLARDTDVLKPDGENCAYTVVLGSTGSAFSVEMK
jgi:hypothetical protein